MSAPGLVPVAGAIGPTSFAVLTWGSIAVVVLAFVYVLWALVLADRTSSSSRSGS